MSIKLVNPSAKSTVFPDILARLQETSREGDWWSRKSEKEQDRYLKDHPNSKKAKELRQQKHGKQSSEDPDAMRDDRMFGEHTDDNKSTERPPEPKKKLVDTNPDNTELKMPPVEEPKGAEAEQPKEGLVSVNPDNTKLEIPPINSPMAEDKVLGGRSMIHEAGVVLLAIVHQNRTLLIGNLKVRGHPVQPVAAHQHILSDGNLVLFRSNSLHINDTCNS
jgi:hypothetical protein